MRCVTVFALVTLIVGCRSGEGHNEAQPQAASAASAKAQVPSFRRDVLPVFDRHCSGPKGCHGAEPTDSIDFDLRESAAYAQLVNHPSLARKGAKRVKPGDPAASFLLNKLTGALDVQEGKQMPIDDDTGEPIVPSPLPPDFVDGVLTVWIRAGAPNN